MVGYVAAFASFVIPAVIGTLLTRWGLASWRRQASFQPKLSLMRRSSRAGFERAFLVYGAFWYFIAAMPILLGASTVHRPDTRPSMAIAIAMLVVLVGTVTTGYLAIMIILFNRPRFLVPPHLRDQPGQLRQLRRRSGRR